MESFFGLGAWEGGGLVQTNVIAPRSFTPERFRGSAIRDKGDVRFLMPYAAAADVICVDELIGFLGTGEGRSKMLALLNSIMESGRGMVDLVKMGDLDLEDIPQEHRSKFHITDTGIEYDASCSFVSATHYLHPKTLFTLMSHGHMSRYDIVAVPFGKMTSFDILLQFIDSAENVSPDLLAEVQYGWKWMQEVVIDNIQPPPRAFIRDVISKLQERERDMIAAGVSWMKPNSFVDGRFISRACRKFIARAIAQLPARYKEFRLEYPELLYEERDVDGVLEDLFVAYCNISASFSEPEEIEMALAYMGDKYGSNTLKERIDKLATVTHLPKHVVSSYVRER
jgi:hypothetical protein